MSIHVIMSENEKKIAYIYDENLKYECDRFPTMLNRASLVHDLITSYNLLKNPDKITIVKSKPASENDLKLFHSSSYLEFMKKTNESEDLEEFEDEQEEFGLGYDCPLLERNYDFIQTIAGGSLTAAKSITDHGYKYAVNFFGGWHHAQRDEAEGFCYVNDIVLAIQKLTEKFKKILYVDLDVHHGNGVQNAFELSDKILTLSFHKYQHGFYPNTGALEEIGMQKGRYYTLNVPFSEGIRDISYLKLFENIFPKVYDAFCPSAIVVQCGADVLTEDPLGQCNVTLNGMGKCFKMILEKELPTLVLGGGGYNFANTARYWTYLLSILLGEDLCNDIPDSCNTFSIYGPTYEIQIDPGNMKDCNSEETINYLIQTISSYCYCIKDYNL